jgi:hypothetical protein
MDVGHDQARFTKKQDFEFNIKFSNQDFYEQNPAPTQGLKKEGK